MPLFYSTSAPTANNRNSITRTAAGSPGGQFGIRDYLLVRNIQNPIRYPQLSTSVNGSPRGGEPFLDTMVGSGVIIQQDPLEVLGVLRYANAIVMNHYKDDDPNAPVYFDIENIPAVPIFPTSPQGTGTYLDEDVNTYGLLAKSDFREFRKLSTIRNLYLDATKQVDMADYISLQPILTSQQQPSYDEAYGQILGLGEFGTEAVDIVGSILNGQGVGVTQQGVIPNFDIRASLAGRVLGATGILNDTKLGTIGAQQLALALANNAAFNTQQAILGKLNVGQNINAIFGSGEFEFPRPNYKITVSDNLGGQLVGTAERILGFTIPRSRLDPKGSIFFTESGPISNIQRANEMLTDTGKGQRKALRDQVKANVRGISQYDDPSQTPFRSGYAPLYKEPNGDKLVNDDKAPNLYAFDDAPAGESTGARSGIVKNFLDPATEDKPINDMNWNREKLVTDAGFIEQPESANSAPFAKNFAWTSNKGSTTNVLQQEAEFVGPGLPAGTTDNKNPQFVGEKKTLLTKTQKLFNSKGMMSMVSGYGSAEGANNKTQINTSVSPNGFISKGSGVLSKFRFSNEAVGQLGNSSSNDSAANTFCRVWIPQNRYDTVSKLIRSRGLNQKENSGGQILTGDTKRGWRLHNSEIMSVLDDNGFVKIAPYKTDNLTRQATLPKKYMFSIENLAWVGSPAVNLLPIEQGPGDLITGKFGRIMWFPPYDLTFSESSTVELETNKFIGRGEPIYTYNNTERTGQLSFKVIVDHPSAMNGFKGNNGPTDEYIRSWFAGCIDDDYFSSMLTTEEKTQIKTIKRNETYEVSAPEVPKIPPFKIYFKNDRVDIDPAYEGAPEGQPGIGFYTSIELTYTKRSGTCKKAEPGEYRQWIDTTSYGLNRTPIKIGDKDFPFGWIASDFRQGLADYLNQDTFNGNPAANCKITITCYGYASTQGCPDQNQILADERANNTKAWLEEVITNGGKNNNITIVANGKGEKKGNYSNDGSVTPQDNKGPKEARYSTVEIIIENTKPTETRTREIEEPEEIALNSQVSKRFYTEQDFFEKLQRDDYFVFDKIRQQIRYFHPAFHSTTPEGFNSRLTFLLQCTRQGPTPSNVEPNNLAFGPSPVCILRIGDFYNTKIMIDSLSIEYEPLIWDLNPEGVGVQPMIANISISFKYIGGSSMYGPINKLQNALSFNYFANSQVYDPRADYIAKISDIQQGLIKNYPSDPSLKTRKTFESKDLKNNKEGNLEIAYGLVPGLDSVNDSMGALENQVAVYVPAGSTVQTVDANNNNGAKSANGTTNVDNNFNQLKLGTVEYFTSTTVNNVTTVENGFIFSFVKEASANFAKDGNMVVNIIGGQDNTEKYTTEKMYTIVSGSYSNTSSNVLKLTSNDNTAPSIDGDGKTIGYIYGFRIKGAETSEPFTGFTSGFPYTFEITVSDVTAEPTVYRYKFDVDNSPTPTPTPAPPAEQTTKPTDDEGIFDNARLLGRYSIQPSKYTSDGKFQGRFSIFSDNELLKADHVAKLNLVEPKQGQLIPIATFTINGTEDRGKGGGNFVTDKGDMINLFSQAIDNLSKDAKNTVAFCVTIPEFNTLKFYDTFSLLEFDCPDYDLKYGDLIEKDEYEDIIANPCGECYANGTRGKKIRINGVDCPMNASNAPTYPETYSDYYTSTDCDAAHDFTGKKGVNSKITLENKVNEIQKKFYDAGINPKITSLTVNITYTSGTYKTEYSVTIDQSSDGKAWMGFATVGSCGSGYITRADAQWNGTTDTSIVASTSKCYNKSREQCYREQLNALEFNTLLVYQNDQLRFKQYFTQFTKSTFPPK